MSQRVLIVEDEALIALDLTFCLEGLGHEVVATAADSAEAMAAVLEGVDLALVDLNLRDGPTGPSLGERLARDWNVTVIYLTANPRQVGPGVRGPVGILAKPYSEATLAQAVRFATSLREGREVMPPPELRLLAGPAPTFERAGREAGF
ncbi:response regulator [Roseomonas sp. SSH11]|uniref:Response regulator n=1 Tax=Pararoseomonas baculiformis TaxID=2820812 RepID=A0ABS4AAB5_9PROT|nr:response regulator [Pararoseomonas baculiformis]MBP0443453.1 response regulator [Pararoseomonas baculiformis]